MPDRVCGVLVAGIVLAAAAGCANPVHLITGGDSIDDYCQALNSHQKQFAEMTSQESPVALLDARPWLKSLGDKAPSDITDDWQSFLSALDGLQKALDKVGVKAAQFVDGKPPRSLSTADRKIVAVAADQVAAPGTVDAVDAIDQEARDVCKINLGL